MGIFSNIFRKGNQEIYSLARLVPKKSQLAVPLYVDDGESWKKSGHWKRLKFKQNDDVVDSRDWAPMNFDGEIMGNPKKLNIKIGQKEVNEIANFARNNKYALENLGVNLSYDFGDFLQILIPGGEPASQERIDELKGKVDELLAE